MYYIILLLGLCTALPVSKYGCIQNPDRTDEIILTHNITEQCFNDDFSRIHIYTKPHTEGTSIAVIKRKYTNINWEDCKPIPSENGILSVAHINGDATLRMDMSVCAKTCIVTIDRYHGQLVLDTDGLNFYEVDGTLYKRGWFKNKQTLDFINTCEQVSVRCGTTHAPISACFKENLECYRFLSKYWLTDNIKEAICANASLLLMMAVIILVFCIILLLMKTLLIFLLIPIYYPICYIISIIYEKIPLKCHKCGLLIHLFSRCGNTCICGLTFLDTASLCTHRMFGGCDGMKKGEFALRMCRNKSSNFTLAILLIVMLSFFVRPINGKDIEPDISDLIPWIDDTLQDLQCYEMKESLVWKFALPFAIIPIVCLIYTLFKIDWFLIKRRYILCEECKCYHKRCSRCTDCICGRIGTGEIDSDTMLPQRMMKLCHTATDECIRGKLYRQSRHINYFSNLYCLIVMIVVFSVKFVDCNLIDNVENCHDQEDLPYSCTYPMLINPADCHIMNSREHEVIEQLNGEQKQLYSEYYKRVNLSMPITSDYPFIWELTLVKRWCKKELQSKQSERAQSRIWNIEQLDICKNVKHELCAILNQKDDYNMRVIKDKRKAIKEVANIVAMTPIGLFSKSYFTEIKDPVTLLDIMLNSNLITDNTVHKIVKFFNSLISYDIPIAVENLSEDKQKDAKPAGFYKILERQQLKTVECMSPEYMQCTDKTTAKSVLIVICAGGLNYYVAPAKLSTPCRHSINLNCRCFDPTCTKPGTKLTATVSNCNIHRPEINSDGTITIVHETLDDYRRKLMETTHGDLISHKFKYTQGQPIVAPNYKSITMQGVETEDGIDEAFIQGDIPVIEGKAIGLKVLTPEGKDILDLIISIGKARHYGLYTKIYDTGKTKTINVKSKEQCTGYCPQDLSLGSENYLRFSKQDSSQWGCEDVGCLAINEGCIWGECMDVIYPEYKIFRKNTDTKQEIEVCLSFQDRSFCRDIYVDEGIETGNFMFNFFTTEADQLPNLIAAKDENIYTGDINDLGHFGSGCGSIQHVDGFTYGQGDPDWAYKCHAVGAKEVVVRKCAQNNYQACRMLKKEDNIRVAKHVDDEKMNKIEILTRPLNLKPSRATAKDAFKLIKNHEVIKVIKLTKSLGTLKFNLKLGNFKYKTYKQTITLGITGSCAGCINCIEETTCHLEVNSDYEVSCNTEFESCTGSLSRIIIHQGKNNLGFKLKCLKNSTEIHGTMCSNTFRLSFKEIPPNKLELESDGQTAYVEQKNEECSTWLCKAFKEGSLLSFFDFSSPFNAIKSFFGWIVGIIMIIMFVMFITYIVIPLVRNLKMILKNKEREYSRIAAQKNK